MTQLPLPLMPPDTPNSYYEYGSITTRLELISAIEPAPREAWKARAILMRADEWERGIRTYYGTDNLIDTPSFQNKIATCIYFTQEVISMPTKSKYSREKKATWKGVLTCELTERQLDEMDEMPTPVTDILISVDRLITDGYKLSVSYSKFHSSAQASLTDENTTRTTGGWTINATGENALDALKILLWKHYKVLGEDWSILLADNKPKTKRG